MSKILTQLQAAIRKLEAFSSKENEDASTTKSIALVVKNLLCRVGFYRGQKGQEGHQEELMQAVEEVNRRRLDIHRLQASGSPREKLLAESFTRIIDQFNAKKAMSKLGHTLPTIQLWQPEHVSLHSEKATGVASLLLLQKPKELFKMKAVTELNKQGIPHHEAICYLKHADIDILELETTSTCVLQQTFSPFPGQTVIIKGKSLLDPATKAVGLPLPETFSVCFQSKQTGFPHPSQHNGWALVAQLLPGFPQRPDLFKDAARTFDCQKVLIQALAPHGALIPKAKARIKQKKQAFALHFVPLISLHRQLVEAILQAAPSRYIPEGAKESIEAFFRDVIDSNSYEKLVQASVDLCSHFVVRPHAVMLEAILKENEIKPTSGNGSKRYRLVEQCYVQAVQAAGNRVLHYCKTAASQPEKNRWRYLYCMGHLLGNAAKEIILQYLSEDLLFPPPRLNSFQGQLLTAAQGQVHAFHDGLMKGAMELGTDEVYEELRSSLLAEIAYFTHPQEQLSRELSHYYQKRYETASKEGAG